MREMFAWSYAISIWGELNWLNILENQVLHMTVTVVLKEGCFASEEEVLLEL